MPTWVNLIDLRHTSHINRTSSHPTTLRLAPDARTYHGLFFSLLSRSTHTMEREPKRRRRPALSCVQCRRRKIKCDRSDPCKHCLAAKHCCTYDTYGARSIGEQRRERRGLQSQGSQPQTVTPDSVFPTLRSAEVAGSTSASQAGTEHDGGGPDGLNDARPSRSGRRDDPYLRELIERVENLERSSTRPADQDRPSDHVLDVNSGLQRSHIILNKTRLLSSSHWKTVTEEVRYYN